MKLCLVFQLFALSTCKYYLVKTKDSPEKIRNREKSGNRNVGDKQNQTGEDYCCCGGCGYRPPPPQPVVYYKWKCFPSNSKVETLSGYKNMSSLGNIVSIELLQSKLFKEKAQESFVAAIMVDMLQT